MSGWSRRLRPRRAPLGVLAVMALVLVLLALVLAGCSQSGTSTTTKPGQTGTTTAAGGGRLDDRGHGPAAGRYRYQSG